MKDLFVFDDKNSRLYEYFEYKNIDAKELHNLLKHRSNDGKPEISYESLRRFFKKNINFKNKTIQYVLGPFNDYNLNYILTGEGEMIKMEGKSIDINYDLVDGEVIPVTYKKKTDILDKSQVLYRKDGVVQVDHSEYMEVEFRDLSVAAGPLNNIDEGFQKKTMLVPKEYDRGEYLVVRVDGPSMDDGSIYSIGDGANILIKKYHLENGARLPIRGNLFVIDSKDGQALKQIIEHNTQERYIVCHSYNPDFSDYKVDLDEIIDFYIYRKIVGYRPPVRDIN